MKRKVRTRKLGIKFKILIPVCVCVLVVCVVMGVNSYKHIQDGMVEMGVQEADMAADLTLRMGLHICILYIPMGQMFITE